MGVDPESPRGAARVYVTADRTQLRRPVARAPDPALSLARDLLFYLRGRTALCRQRDVGERRVMRGSMPMLLFRGNMNDIAWRDDLLLRFCRDDAIAGGHK